MTINEYQKNALRTANKSLTSFQQLENGIMGLNGEAGECIDILKNTCFRGMSLTGSTLLRNWVILLGT